MKQTTKAALVGAVIATAVVMASPLLLRTSAKAAQVDPESAALSAEQYKVVPLQKFDSAPGLEQEINRLAADGWRVRCGAGSGVILAK